MNNKQKREELSLESQFHLQRTKQALPKMSREQLEAYTETVLTHHLWMDEKYKQMLKTK